MSFLPPITVSVFGDITNVQNNLNRASSHIRRFTSLGSSFKSFGADAASGTDTVTASLRRFTWQVGQAIAAYLSLRSLFRLGTSFVQAAGEKESLMAQLATYLGSMEAAQKRFKELEVFAVKTPFELIELTRVSKLLQVTTGGALAAGEGLRLVGDAAAAVNPEMLDVVASNMGRIYRAAYSGDKVGHPFRQLSTLMGVITPKARELFNQMQSNGMRGAKVWQVIADDLKRFDGSMDRFSYTWEGKMSNLVDAWGMFKRAIGEPIMDSLRPLLQMLIDFVVSSLPAAKALGEKLASFVTKLRDFVQAMILMFKDGKLGEFFELALVQAVKHAANQFLSLFMGALELIRGTLGTQAFWSDVKDVLMGMGKIIVGFVLKMAEVLMTDGAKYVAPLLAAVILVKDTLVAAFEYAVAVLDLGMMKAVDRFRNAFPAWMRPSDESEERENPESYYKYYAQKQGFDPSSQAIMELATSNGKSDAEAYYMAYANEQRLGAKRGLQIPDLNNDTKAAMEKEAIAFREHWLAQYPSRAEQYARANKRVGAAKDAFSSKGLGSEASQAARLAEANAMLVNGVAWVRKQNPEGMMHSGFTQATTGAPSAKREAAKARYDAAAAATNDVLRREATRVEERRNGLAAASEVARMAEKEYDRVSSYLPESNPKRIAVKSWMDDSRLAESNAKAVLGWQEGRSGAAIADAVAGRTRAANAYGEEKGGVYGMTHSFKKLLPGVIDLFRGKGIMNLISTLSGDEQIRSLYDVYAKQAAAIRAKQDKPPNMRPIQGMDAKNPMGLSEAAGSAAKGAKGKGSLIPGFSNMVVSSMAEIGAGSGKSGVWAGFTFGDTRSLEEQSVGHLQKIEKNTDLLSNLQAAITNFAGGVTARLK